MRESNPLPMSTKFSLKLTLHLWILMLGNNIFRSEDEHFINFKLYTAVQKNRVSTLQKSSFQVPTIPAKKFRPSFSCQFRKFEFYYLHTT
jgi:hypothetical protein